FHRHDAGLREPGFDGASAATQRPAGAIAGYEGVYWPGNLSQDFRAGAVLVILEVERVFELARQKVARIPRGHLPRAVNACLIAATTGKQYHLRAQPPEQLPPLPAGALAHQDCYGIAPGSAGHCQRNASVTAGAFENNGARLQEPPPFGIGYGAPGEAVLDAAARVEKLTLGVDRQAFRFKAQ